MPSTWIFRNLRFIVIQILVMIVVLVFLMQSKPNRPDNGTVAALSSFSKSATITDIKVLAFYFPQYHEIPENNEFWGKGFTEWNNVRGTTHNKWGKATIQPTEELGYYNLLDYDVRKKQGDLMKEHGITGLIIHHYWFSDHPVMNSIPEKMLEDGEPDVDFFFNWANEPWSKRWDGGSNEVLLNQTYGSEPEWDKHVEWLVRFFRSPRYIKVNGAPVFGIYRSDFIPPALIYHMKRAIRNYGFPGVHIVDVLWARQQPQPWADSCIEFQPNLSGHMANFDFFGFPELPRRHDIFHRGTNVGWDNGPRHPTDGKGTWSPFSHPQLFFEHLTEMLSKITKDPNPSGFPNWLVINAMNEWGEGNALEPSVQFGRGFLQAIKKALQLHHSGVSKAPTHDLPQIFDAPDVGKDTNPSICVLVRTNHGHSPKKTAFHLGRLLESLRQQRNPNWEAFVFQTDSVPFGDLDEVIRKYGDVRVQRLDLEPEILAQHRSNDTGYVAIDTALRKAMGFRGCASSQWLLFANGGDTYLPWAFSFGDRANVDVLSMNFMSHWTFHNKHAEQLGTGRDHETRCTSEYVFGKDQLWGVQASAAACTAVWPDVGDINLGANFFRASRFVEEGLQLSNFAQSCAPLCQDGAFIRAIIAKGWQFEHLDHPSRCHFLHDPTPATCHATGGIWFDSPKFEEYGCLALGNAAKIVRERAADFDLDFMNVNPLCIRYNHDTFKKLILS